MEADPKKFFEVGFLLVEDLPTLRTHTSRISPFSDWEAVTMEALIGLGRYEEADRLYADTAQIYFEERGLRPSQKLLDSLKQLGDQFEHPYEAVGLVQEN